MDRRDERRVRKYEKSFKISRYLKNAFEPYFLLRKGASKIGMGAVLLKKNNKEVWVPVQWASKKFIPTEVRYSVPEKRDVRHILGSEEVRIWVKGRKFKIEKDHKSLEEMRNNPDFENNRINRWVKKIQKFYLMIEYRKGSHRCLNQSIYTWRTREKEMISNRRDKQIEGKLNKHIKRRMENSFGRLITARKRETYWLKIVI